MKRFLSALLGLTLLVTMLSAPAALAEVFGAATSLRGASKAQRNNILLAAEALNGVYVASGEAFSFNGTVGPRTADAGYVSAVGGSGSKAVGGGVSQVASTIYLALKQVEGIEYLEKTVYGRDFAGDYVQTGADAIVTDYTNDYDFSFINGGEDLSISLWTTDSEIECFVTVGEGGGFEDESFGDEYFEDDSFEDDSFEDDSFEDENFEDEGFEDESFEDESFEDESFDDGLEAPSGAPIGSAQFDVDGSDALIDNVERAALSFSGLVVRPGDVVSFNEIVGPRTEENGYRIALNGRGVKVVGGGVAQVASALWLAVKDLDGITVVSKSTYGAKYNQSYVDDPDDAILTGYVAKTDFRFKNSGYGQLTLYARLEDGALICELYED